MIFKRIFILAMAAIAGVACVPAQKTHTTKTTEKMLTMLVGTYTQGSSSKGIYVYRFNQVDGTATLVSHTIAKNPSYLVATDNNKYVYSVNEFEDGQQSVSAFALNKAKGTLRMINSQPTGIDTKSGAAPCYVTTDGKFVITANYSGGDITVFPIAKDGGVMPVSQRYTFSSKTPGVVAHLHCVHFSPDGKYLFADDLGNDCIYRFMVNGDGKVATDDSEWFDGMVHIQSVHTPGTPVFLNKAQVAFNGEKKMGPRHLTFNTKGDHAYLINELGGIVVAFDYKDGTLTPIQTIMADEGEGHGSADIHISLDGKFLYTSHRLKKDGVAIFSIDASNGKLTKVGYQLTGRHPRNFNITPNGKYLLLASRDDNTIEIYQRNLKTGLLTDTHKRIEVGKPVCVQFLK